jgi:hypothetical protein
MHMICVLDPGTAWQKDSYAGPFRGDSSMYNADFRLKLPPRRPAGVGAVFELGERDLHGITSIAPLRPSCHRFGCGCCFMVFHHGTYPGTSTSTTKATATRRPTETITTTILDPSPRTDANTQEAFESSLSNGNRHNSGSRYGQDRWCCN